MKKTLFILFISLSTITFAQKDSTVVAKNKKAEFRAIEKPPIYPGCNNVVGSKKILECFSYRIRQHLMSRIGKTRAIKVLPKGKHRIKISFKVNTSGRIEILKVETKFPNVKKEVEKALINTPKIKPGTQRGRPVNVPFRTSLLIER